MFDNLTARLSRAVESLRGRGRITPENVVDTLREARLALLEADVALPVVKSFIESVRAQALGAEVLGSLTPGQAFIGILHKQLVEVMGGEGAGGGGAGGGRGVSGVQGAYGSEAVSGDHFGRGFL